MTDYYVANTPTGNDGNTGLIGDPWETMAKVNAGSFSAGDNIYFNRGDSWSDAILTVSWGGSEDNPITFGAYGTGAKPIFNNTAEGIRMWEAGANYTTIQDIHLQGQSDGGAKGIEIYGAKTNLIISRVDIEDPAHNGINLTQVDGFIIEDCVIWESLGGIIVAGNAGDTAANGIIRNNIIYRTTANTTDGIYFFPSDGEVGSNFLIEGNEIYGWGEEALDPWSGNNFIVRDNIVHDNTRGLKAGGGTPGAVDLFFDGNYSYGNGRGMYLDGGTNVRLRWNKVRDSSGRFVQLNSNPAGGDFWACHNTFYDDDTACSAGTLHIWADCGDIIAKNNIWVSPNNSNPASFVNDIGADSRTFDYNYYYRNDNDDTQVLWDGKNWADWQTEGQDANGAYADPLLVDPPGGNFNIASGSPCVDAGGWITTISSSTGTGTSFVVVDSKWFCDGFGLTTGDKIQLEGKPDSVTITDVNYSTHTITVDVSVSWTSGDGVAFTYNGSAPDVGCYETISSDLNIDVILKRA